MLTVFENGVGYPIQNDDYYIRLLASGYDEVVFNVDIRDPVYQYINEEAVIRDRNQNVYLVKQIDAGEKTAKVVAQINLDDWKQTLYMDYSNESATVAGTVLGILPTGWNMVDYSGITKRRTVPTSDTTKDYNVTALEILEDCVKIYEVRFRFNTASKIISIINPASYQPVGAFATRDLNLKKLNYKGKSDSFVTRLYASGKDGMTFASINDGKAYVENHTYSNKVISAYWGDERYTDKQSLLDDATAKLAEMAQPSRSYDCEVLDLANTNPEMYGFEDFSLFSVVTLVDDAKEVRTDYQVVERWEYPYYPVKNKIVLSSSTPNIQSAIAQVVNAISSSTSGFQQIIQSAITNATSLITGNSGGYLVLHDSNDDGTPDELLIMDTPDIATATKVWRWNSGGLGYSGHGYNPQPPYGYELGITMDGSIVATLITSGTLNADVIRAGIIQDVLGRNTWNLETGELSLSAGTTVDGNPIAGAIIHSFISNDIMDDISNWKWKTAAAGTISIVQIDGANCLALDGTSLSAYNSDYYAYTSVELIGRQTLKIAFKMRFSEDVTIAQQHRWFIYYYNEDTQGYIYNWEDISGTYEKDTWYDYEFSWTMLGSADITKYVPIFGIWHIPNTIMYIKDLSLTASVDSYTQASLDFTTNGLKLAFEEAEGTHDYLPYDYLSNLGRYTGTAAMSFPYFTTIDGKTYVAFDADGVSTVTSDDEASLPSDFLGKPTLNISFKYRFNKQYTSTANERFFGISYKDKTNTYREQNRVWGSPFTFEANRDYSTSFTITLDYDAMTDQRVNFYYHPDVVIYFTDVKIETTETAYNSAALTVSAEGLSSVVQSGNIISAINQTAERVSIRASKIDLTGDLSLRGDFHCYNPSDNRDYAFLDDGNLQFVVDNVVEFTVATEFDGNFGIFFGDAQDVSANRYTTIRKEKINTRKFYLGDGGAGSTAASMNFSGLIADSPIYYYSTGAYLADATDGYTGIVVETDIKTQHLTIGGSGLTILNPSGTTSSDIWGSVRFYGTVYDSGGGQVFISDKRKKRSIKDLVIEKARSFIMALKPRKFKFTKDISESDRFHHGFIAQEVKEAMPEDWGLYVENEKQDFIGLRYDEILADLVAVVQDQQKRIEELERRVDDLTNN